MYEIVKNVIINKNYKLEDILQKIDVIWLESKITDEQKAELITLARENALAENSYASIEKRVEEVFTRLIELDKAVRELKGEGTEDTNEYKEYVQPTGSHDCYNTGDKVLYNNKKYICKVDGCVWSPEAYPAAWEEITEGKITEVVE
ncbi:MAG: hypothetical protein Q4D02_01725 [Clostridia bacterium]|nr:hypothetical protein [Clostridia bacterium]